MIAYLIKLDTLVPLKELHEKGIIDWKLIRDRDMFLQYDIYIKKGFNKMKAYRKTAKEFGLKVRQTITIIHNMEDGSTGNTH